MTLGVNEEMNTYGEEAGMKKHIQAVRTELMEVFSADVLETIREVNHACGSLPERERDHAGSRLFFAVELMKSAMKTFAETGKDISARADVIHEIEAKKEERRKREEKREAWRKSLKVLEMVR